MVQQLIPDSLWKPNTLAAVTKFMLGAFVLYIGALILTPFPHYLPPNFDKGFLRNKAELFYSTGYFIGFYTHILSAPLGLLLGTLQMSAGLRHKRPGIHRRLGKTYVWLVLLAVAPGGIIMAMKAYGGWSSTICFGLIGVLMWLTTWRAWQEARAMRFRQHAIWMCRSYTLMCSAIMLRLISYGLSQFELDHMFSYQLSVWLSWLPAMIILELAIWFCYYRDSSTGDSSTGEPSG